MFETEYIKLQQSTSKKDFVDTMDCVEACAAVYDKINSPELTKQIHKVLYVLWHEVGQNESCFILNKALGPYVKSYNINMVPEDLTAHPDFVRTCLYLSALLDSGMSFNTGGEKHYTRELLRALPGVSKKSPPKNGWVEFVAHGLLRQNWQILKGLYPIDTRDIAHVREELLKLPDEMLVLNSNKKIAQVSLPTCYSTSGNN